ncbi:hypothetical protein EVAR_24057_1 [Eumeta japonica]|uniref:Uncharacterized protein n=1 Tax=Eumeta variegata TaxID=151549 RepID=A0A4C1VTQ5_EUMVA|nr:hypothetical protein EVAR_24057_1 [Eumeta japonica]
MAVLLRTAADADRRTGILEILAVVLWEKKDRPLHEFSTDQVVGPVKTMRSFSTGQKPLQLSRFVGNKILQGNASDK